MEEDKKLSIDGQSKDNLTYPNRWLKRLLHLSDTIVSLLIITPLAVAHWRGTWTFMDHYEEIFPPWHCFLLGSVLHTAFALLRESLHEEFSNVERSTSICRTIRHFVISKIYTYVFSVACILQWRGGWAVLDLHFGHTITTAITVTTATFIVLVGIRCVRNTLAPPFVIIMDYKDSAFIFPTRFRVKSIHKPGLYVLDCVFSVLFVGTLVVFVWRGLWLLTDILLFPNDKHLSTYSSLIIGYGTVAVIFAIQPIMSDFFTVWLSSSPDKCTKRLLNFGDTLLSWFIISPLAIAHWRGTWDYMDQRPDKFPAWYCFILGGILHTVFALLREPLHAEFSPPSNGNKSLKKTIKRIIVTKLYTYIFSVGSIMHWRGGWAMMELHLGPGVWPAVIVSFITLIPLLILKSLRNSLAPPYIILMDSKDVAFIFPTRYRIEFFFSIVSAKMRGSTAGLADGVLNPSKDAHGVLLDFLDTILSTVVVGPLVISYWRGTWNLMDLYLFPNNTILSAYASLTIGVVGHIVFTLCQDTLKQLHPNHHRITFYVISRLYTAVYGVICINGWRGGWQLIDSYTTPKVSTVLIFTTLPALCLTFLKTLRNLSAAPFTISIDTPNEYFDVQTMFKTSGSRQPLYYILDCCFSVLIIGSLVVFVWRGVWVFLDLVLYPSDAKLSAWYSLAIGYGIVFITFALQPVMRWTCEKLTGFLATCHSGCLFIL
uniref:Uncharacterized protein n=1 Tax=Lutzomyia longipalpis TaxID=7200 RepID=A0A1B0CBC9_LUTLO